MHETKSPSRAVPLAVVLVSAALWGLFWIPLRAFEQQGLQAAWATLAQFVVPCLLLSPIAAWRKFKSRPAGFSRMSTGLIVGAAFVLYYQSLLLTDVVRALLLFYITPIWGTILEALVLKRRVTTVRMTALFLGACGLLLVLTGNGGWPVPQNAGDCMALLSGFAFAVGALHIRSSPDMEVFEHVFSFFFYGGLFAFAMTLLPLPAMGKAPEMSLLFRLIPWLLAMATLFLIPVMWGLLWGAKHLDPGRLGILFQLEAVVGIGSAALLTNERFGWPEAAATVLIVGAGVLDVLDNDGDGSGSIARGDASGVG